MAGPENPLQGNLSELPMSKKILLAAAAAAGLALIAVIWLWTQKPDFKTLYTHLSSEDAGAVINKFKEMNVPYRFSADGSSILVPSERVHELRLQLASQGLPQGGGVGFEIFDRSAFGTTEFAQKLNYRRALQGELSRTISQLDEVRQARVHLVVPEQSLFTEHQESARAAVVLSLHPGKRLSTGQIQGIAHLVAGSVEGLDPDAVTIVDSKGSIRSVGSEEMSPFKKTQSQLEYQQHLEAKIERKIQSMLARVVGPNKAVVRVSASLDFRQVELTEERFDPDGRVIRSEQRSQGQESGTATTSKPSGIPGVASNVPPDNQQAGAAGTSKRNNSQKSNEVLNYEVSKTVSRVVEPFGTIQQLSVAALIDGSYETLTDDEGQTTRKYIPRSEQEMADLKAIVKKAMGFSAERKDQLEVINTAFQSSQKSDEMALPPESMLDKVMRWMPLARQVMGPLMILLVLFVMIKPAMKTLMSPPQQALPLPQGAGSIATQTALPGAASQAPLGIEGAQPQETLQLEGKSSGSPERLEGTAKKDSLQLEDGSSSGELSREDIIKLAGENPQAAPQLVKQWISED